MNRSYLTGLITLFSAVSPPINASDWEQAHHHFSAFTAIQHNNNLFNTAAEQQQDQRLQAGLQWDWLGLYEGYGVQLPVLLKRQQWREQAGLDQTLYQAAPELRLFLNPQTDLSLRAVLNKDQALAGDGIAEFVPAAERALVSEQRSLFSTLSFGRAPDVQNLQLTLGTDRQTQDIATRQYTKLDAVSAAAHYSHKLNENLALVLDAERRQEEQNQQQTDLNQYGAGVSVQWTGQQHFRLTAGRFQRSYKPQANQQAAADLTGSYWQLSNLWQLDERWQLQLSSGRSSVLSYSTLSVSQLETRHQAQLGWQATASHRLTAAVSRQRSVLDQHAATRSRTAASLIGYWQISQQWQTQLQLSRVSQQHDEDLKRQRTEVAAEVRWSW